MSKTKHLYTMADIWGEEYLNISDSNSTNTSIIPPTEECLMMSFVLENIEDNPSLVITYLALLAPMTAFGNIGNPMVLGAIWANPRLHKTGNILFINLALADFCVSGKLTPCFISKIFTVFLVCLHYFLLGYVEVGEFRIQHFPDISKIK